MPKPRAALGRGLNALIPGASFAQMSGDEGGDAADAAGRLRGAALEVPIESIKANPQQPRQEFAEDPLKELADSIREHGVLQPLIVTRNETENSYYLIAGERRWRAARLAGLPTVPVIVKEANPEEMLALALVENIQRADLNPLEEAQAYRELIDNFHLTQTDVARLVGRSRIAVANLVRLLNLPREIVEALHHGTISEGHARALLGLDGREAQLAMLEQVITEGYSVRQTEEMVRRVKEPPAPDPEAPPAPTPRRARRAARPPADRETGALEAGFTSALNTRVQLSRSRQGGRLVIHFYSEEMLDHLYRLLVGEPD